MASYYFSNTGSDAAAGTIGAPWQTMAKFNSSFSGFAVGDFVYFERGGTWNDAAMTISRSGSAGNVITISAYGAGAKPIITSFATVSAWTNSGSNIWISNSAVSTLSSLNVVSVSGTNTGMGRFPNTGYRTITSHSTTTTVTSSGMGASPSFIGGEVVIRESRWNLARHPITNHVSDTITYSGGVNEPIDGYGFFIQADIDCCTAQNEWFYNTSTKKLQIYTTSDPTSFPVKCPAYNNLVTLVGRSYITFDNLQFTGANNNCFDMTSSTNHIIIQNCDIDFTGVYALSADSSCSAITFTTGTINHSNSNAAHTSTAGTVTITLSDITNSGQIAGMGGSDADDYIGLYVIGDTSTITYNNILNSGYNAVEFNGNNSNVSNNNINTCLNIKDDGGGIYAWNDGGSPPTLSGRTVNNNIIQYAVGAADGTDDPALLAHGIYMDDNSMGVTISGNGIAYCGEAGIFLHNAHEITCTNNVCYGNRVQLTMTQDTIPSTPSPLANITLTGNVLFAALATQEVLEVANRTTASVDFGTYNNNYYTRPLDELTGTNLGPIVACFGAGGSACSIFPWPSHTIATWQTLSGEDANTTKSLLPALSSADVQFIYNETNVNKSVNLGTRYWRTPAGVLYGNTVVLAPYTSLALVGADPIQRRIKGKRR